MRDSYHGNDRVNTANGQGMEISLVGTSIVHNPVQNFYLRDILHVPTATRNLLSVHRFTLDNRVFIEFHPFFFLIKDQVTRQIIQRGCCVGGLYRLISSLVSSSSKRAFVAAKLTQARWHSHLDHPSEAVVSQIVSKNNLPSIKDSSLESQCVIHACSLRVINSHIPYPLVFRLALFIRFFLMYVVLRLLLWENMIII
jgi:hypothetical protein